MNITAASPYFITLKSGYTLSISIASGSALVEGFISGSKAISETYSKSTVLGPYSNNVDFKVSLVSGVCSAVISDAAALSGIPTYPTLQDAIAAGASDFKVETQLYIGGSPVGGDTTSKLTPSAPTNVLASASNASATVQWKAKLPIPSTYTVTASPGGASVTVLASSINQSVLITNLINSTAYTFSVTAENSNGSSKASAVSNSVTPTALPSTVLPVTRGLEFWWSASRQPTPPANLGVITTLTDLSGNGYHAAGVAVNAGGKWMTSWSGGKPAVTFNGNLNSFDTSATGLYCGMRGAQGTIYVVYDITNNPNQAWGQVKRSHY